MAAVAFDPLEYAHQLEASGVSREQAEVHAKAMTAMFLHNFDALVTKDYLDSRFNAFETRVEAKMDKRLIQMASRLEATLVSRMDEGFSRVDARLSKVDERFSEVDRRFSEVDKRFAGLESEMDRRFADFRLEMHRDFEAVHSKTGELRSTLQVHSWMFALLMAGIFIPLVRQLFS